MTTVAAAAFSASAAFSAASFDANALKNRDPLWPERHQPEGLNEDWDTLKAQWEADAADWSFCIDWYERIVDGNPMDWDLIFQIATEITDDEWDAGQSVVGPRIAEIIYDFNDKSGNEPRQETFEPKDISHIFAHRQVVTVTCQRISVDIASAIEQFHSDTGLNRIPPEFEPLSRLPNSLSRFSALLSRERSKETEQALREENGRLTAEIARLEAELEKLRDAKSPTFTPALRKQIANSLGDWKLYGAIVAGLWIISGDDLGMQTRLENLLSLREATFGADCPAPETGAFDFPTTEV